MTNTEKQQLKLDTERAIEIFKIATEWDQRGYEVMYGPLNHKTAHSWPATHQLMVAAGVGDLVLHIQRCRRLGCEPTMQSFACTIAMTTDMQEHLIEHNEHDEE